jgi:hypothetical protein
MQEPPKELSEWARGVWREVAQDNEFDAHEIVVFERALRWWDVSDDAAKQAATATGAELTRFTKLSLDASTAALRHWRALKFETGTAKRPGRPAGVNWSKHRKAAASA